MAHGYFAASDIINESVDGHLLSDIWAEFQETLKLANDRRTAIGSLFTHRTTTAADDILQSATTGDEFEEASEFGVPSSIRSGLEFIRVGFPLKWYDLAARYTSAFLRDATREQIENVHARALEADSRLVYKGILKALMFKDGGGTNSDGTAIVPLWNGTDDRTPPEFDGKAFEATHNHYLTSQSVDVDGEDLKDLINHVQEHGYGAGSDQMLILVHPDQGEVIRSFRVADGSPFDFISSEEAPAYLTSEQLVGKRPPSSFNGLKVIGSYGDALIVQDRFIPSGYLVATATGGANSEHNVIGQREHVKSEYQGLRQIPGNRQAYPLVDSYYTRGVGFGVKHRGAAAVMQVTTATEYTNPSL